MLNVLKAVLKENAAKEEGTTNPVQEPEANLDFEQRKHKWNSSEDQTKKNLRKPLHRPLE